MLDLLVNQTNAKDEEKVNDEVVLLFFGVCQIFQVSKLKKGDFDLQNRYLRKKCIGFAKANNFVKSNYTYTYTLQHRHRVLQSRNTVPL